MKKKRKTKKDSKKLNAFTKGLEAFAEKLAEIETTTNNPVYNDIEWEERKALKQRINRR